MCCMARFIEMLESPEFIAIIEPKWAGRLLRYVVLFRPNNFLLPPIVNCNPASWPIYSQAAAREIESKLASPRWSSLTGPFLFLF